MVKLDILKHLAVPCKYHATIIWLTTILNQLFFSNSFSLNSPAVCDKLIFKIFQVSQRSFKLCIIINE